MWEKLRAPIKIVDLSMIHLSLRSAYGRFATNDLHAEYANSNRIAWKLKTERRPFKQRGTQSEAETKKIAHMPLKYCTEPIISK